MFKTKVLFLYLSPFLLNCEIYFYKVGALSDEFSYPKKIFCSDNYKNKDINILDYSAFLSFFYLNLIYPNTYIFVDRKVEKYYSLEDDEVFYYDNSDKNQYGFFRGGSGFLSYLICASFSKKFLIDNTDINMHIFATGTYDDSFDYRENKQDIQNMSFKCIGSLNKKLASIYAEVLEEKIDKAAIFLPLEHKDDITIFKIKILNQIEYLKNKGIEENKYQIFNMLKLINSLAKINYIEKVKDIEEIKLNKVKTFNWKESCPLIDKLMFNKEIPKEDEILEFLNVKNKLLNDEEEALFNAAILELPNFHLTTKLDCDNAIKKFYNGKTREENKNFIEKLSEYQNPFFF